MIIVSCCKKRFRVKIYNVTLCEVWDIVETDYIRSGLDIRKLVHRRRYIGDDRGQILDVEKTINYKSCNIILD